MRRASLSGVVAVAVILSFTLAGAAAQAQSVAQASDTTQPPATQADKDSVIAIAKVQVAIGKVRDSIQAELAATRNKTPEAQKELQEHLRQKIEEILSQSGFSEQEYQRRMFLVSTDPDVRKTYDAIIVELTGAPIPGQAAAAAAARGGGGRGGAAAPVAVPEGPAGTHIGHVMNAFGDTPNGAGLLPTAMAEARIASQHATLASRDPSNLANMKLHAGHVLHALDPTIVTMGPGQGYGAKKAALAVASHIELAANSDGAAPAIKTHSVHVATAARTTGKRIDQIIVLARQIQEATDAAAAAALLSQVVSLAEQVIAGADANGDGRVTWEEGEGGLQQAEEHVMLMLRP